MLRENGDFDSAEDFSDAKQGELSPMQLPYHTDGECHLIVNPAFYSCDSGVLIGSPAEGPDFMDADITPAMMDESMKEVCSEATEVFSNAPTETSVPEPDTVSVPVPAPTPAATMALGENTRPGLQRGGVEEQLDFIIESTKKHPKARNGEAKRVKAHKKPEQLAILQTELANLTAVTREQIRAVARQTGLKEVQVYKWTWDQRRKMG